MDRGCNTVQVDRHEDGFHIVLIARGAKWNASQISRAKSIPVVSITEAYDPALEDPLKELRKRHGG
jgi:hypothetical protein